MLKDCRSATNAAVIFEATGADDFRHSGSVVDLGVPLRNARAALGQMLPVAQSAPVEQARGAVALLGEHVPTRTVSSLPSWTRRESVAARCPDSCFARPSGTTAVHGPRPPRPQSGCFTGWATRSGIALLVRTASPRRGGAAGPQINEPARALLPSEASITLPHRPIGANRPPSGSENRPELQAIFEWAIQDSNLGPLPYQRSALTD
jgi:hypothetical protein